MSENGKIKVYNNLKIKFLILKIKNVILSTFIRNKRYFVYRGWLKTLRRKHCVVNCLSRPTTYEIILINTIVDSRRKNLVTCTWLSRCAFERSYSKYLWNKTMHRPIDDTVGILLRNLNFLRDTSSYSTIVGKSGTINTDNKEVRFKNHFPIPFIKTIYPRSK